MHKLQHKQVRIYMTKGAYSIVQREEDWKDTTLHCRSELNAFRFMFTCSFNVE